MHTRSVLLIMLSCLALAGCKSAQPQANPTETAARALLGSSSARAVPIFHGDTGTPASWNDLVTAAAASDVVLIGEAHGHPLGSAAAAALWDDLLATPGVADHAALSMEFFDRSEQTLLDDYLTGVIDEPALLKTGNHQSYVAYPFGHRAMINAAKARNVPVIGANAPRVYVRVARADGYDRLSALKPDQRRLFRIPDRLPPLDNGYRQRFDEFMSGQTEQERTAAKATPEDKAAERERLDASFRSQSLWDWTMADSIAGAVESGRRPVVQVIGRFHVEHDGGTPQALAAIRPGLRTLVLSFIDVAAPSLRAEDHRAADFIVYTGPM